MLIIQTCDPFRYFPLFAITQRTAAVYAERNGHQYEAFVGICRGHRPWHATYNRILLLKQLITRGARGWVLYLDADSYITDLRFDMQNYLGGRMDCSFIFAPAVPNAKPWQVNAGIFFANLSNDKCLRVCEQWYADFMTRVSDETLANNKGSFDIYPDDQQLIQSIIEGSDAEIQNSIYVDQDQTFNYEGGKFARQVIRAHFTSFDARLESAQSEIGEILTNSRDELTGSL